MQHDNEWLKSEDAKRRELNATAMQGQTAAQHFEGIFDFCRRYHEHMMGEARVGEINLWREGFAATGQREHAKYCGTYQVETIQEAVELYKQTWDESQRHHFSDDNLSCWGCRFFDNETDARKAFK